MDLKSEDVVAELEKLKAKVAIEAHVSATCLARQAKPDAISFILLAAHAAGWQLQAGKPTCIKDGDVVFSKDGQTPLTMEEWVDSLAREAPCLFKK